MRAAADAPLLVLGLGNILCGDDGIGIRAVHALLDRWEPPSNVRVLDGGTLGLPLLGWFESGQDVLLVDAIRTDEPVGSLVRLEGCEVAPAVQSRLSVHQIGVADLLDALELLGVQPRRLSLLGLVPEHLGLGLELSPAVARSMPMLIGALADEIRGRGHDMNPRTPSEACAPMDGNRRADRALGL